MPRPRRFVEPQEADEASGSPAEPPRAEFQSEMTSGPPADPEAAQRLEKVGFGAYAEWSANAQADEPQPTVGRGHVLTGPVAKFDARTGGKVLSFPAGTPVTDLPEWLGQDVLDTPGLTREA